ncbi:MAG: hypothetical protein EB060_07275 [Proteobacteria bacterium]|nr:hypothetical protein [Pseudomonadota bacterium]
MTNDFSLLKQVVERLHTGVKYGKGQMVDQVLGAAEIAKTAGNPELEALALLHKSQEKKRISETQKPLTDDEIILLVDRALGEGKGAKVVDALKYMKTEPEDNDKAREQEMQLAWAAAAPELVKQMLMVEKIVNFETSLRVLEALRDDPKLDGVKPPEWHKNYYITRWEMVEVALKDASPELYDRAYRAGKEGTELASKLMPPERESWVERFKKDPSIAVGVYLD